MYPSQYANRSVVEDLQKLTRSDAVLPVSFHARSCANDLAQQSPSTIKVQMIAILSLKIILF
jgi:hypothetical protein